MQPFDVSVPNVARMYDVYLGGKDNFAADREAAQKMIEKNPQIPAAALGNRAFLKEAVTAVAQSGVKQFIDIGSGLPVMENTHEVVRKVDPGIKTAYVDSDPIVIMHSQNILSKGGTQENVFVLDGDVRESVVLLHLLSEFIDFTKPVALMFIALMHFVETPECYELVQKYMDELAPGSYLILSHGTADYLSEEQAAVIDEEYEYSNAEIYLRDKQQVTRFFDGLELLDPGVTDVATWRAGPVVAQPTMVYGGVGRKVAA